MDLLADCELVDEPRGPRPGSLAMAAEVCAVLAEAIKACPLSRAEIAARMGDLTGDEITLHSINKWTSKAGDKWRFPLEYAVAFEVATGSRAISQLIASRRGLRLMTPRQGRDAEIGRAQREIAEMQARLRSLLGGA